MTSCAHGAITPSSTQWSRSAPPNGFPSMIPTPLYCETNGCSSIHVLQVFGSVDEALRPLACLGILPFSSSYFHSTTPLSLFSSSRVIACPSQSGHQPWSRNVRASCNKSANLPSAWSHSRQVAECRSHPLRKTHNQDPP